MFANRHQAILLALLVSLAGSTIAPQLHAGTPPGDGKYSLVAYVGGGYSRYAATPGGPAPGVPFEVTKSGLAGTVRVMWVPDHLIRLGLETGWTTFYSYKFGAQNEGEMSLSGVPVIAVWSMNVLQVDLFAGAGYYRLNSNLDYQSTVNASTWSLGWLAAASYTHPLTERLGVAGELKWMNAVESHDAVVTIQVQLVWKFLEW
jgi:hypothetical protein